MMAFYIRSSSSGKRYFHPVWLTFPDGTADPPAPPASPNVTADPPAPPASPNVTIKPTASTASSSATIDLSGADILKPAVRAAARISSGIDFATGVNVTVRMNNGDQYTGEIVSEVGGFLWLKLTVPFDDYAPGVVVHLNESMIVAVG
ncbi:MAG TPA: hypothetical protein VMW83_16420 [Spirochaetia bacterium]|nr:hypothetical protein [Spirochaetia bacterium]